MTKSTEKLAPTAPYARLAGRRRRQKPHLIIIIALIVAVHDQPAASQSSNLHCEPFDPGTAPPVLFKVSLTQNTEVGYRSDGTEVEADALMSSSVLERSWDQKYSSSEGTGHLYAYSSINAHGGQLTGHLVTESSHNVPSAGALAQVSSQTSINVYVRVDTTVDWRLRMAIEGAMAETSTDSRHGTVSYTGWGPSIVDDFSYHVSGDVSEFAEETGRSSPTAYDVTTFPEYPDVKYARIARFQQNLWSRFGWGYCSFRCPEPSHAETSIDISFTIDVSVGDCRRLGSADLLDYLYLRDVDWANTFHLASSETTVDGFVADGVTPIVIRTPRFTCPGTVAITVTDEYESTDPFDVGALKDSPDGALANPLNVPLRNIPGTEEWIGFAYLRAPTDFVRQAHYAEDAERGRNNPRKLTACMRYCPLNGTCVDLPETTIELHRPPVLLLHGLHDTGASWKWSLLHDPKYLTWAPSYDNAADFKSNGAAMAGLASDLLNLCRAQDDIAVTQVDVFGHSMGGVLARWHWLNLSGNYVRPDNFFMGDFHKVVTINTPHLGSQAAPLLVTRANTLTIPGCVAARLYPDRPLLDGAVRDLRPDSDAINLLNSEPPSSFVYAHALASRAGTDFPFRPGYWWEKAAPAAICYFGPAIALSGPLAYGIIGLRWTFLESHDCAVGLTSQTLGLASGVTMIDDREGQHYPLISRSARGPGDTTARLLLDAPSSADVWLLGGFPTTALRVGLPDPCAYPDASQYYLCSGLTIASDGDGLFSQPVAGSVVASGTPLHVQMSDSAIVAASAYILAASTGEMQVLRDSPWATTLDVPIEFVGSLVVSAAALDDAGRILEIGRVDVQVEPLAELQELSVVPDRIELSARAPTRQLLVLGMYSDGILRDLSSVRSGSQFDVANGAIASVTDGGRLAASAIGATSIEVRNGSLATTIQVAVASIVFDWDKDGDVDNADLNELIGCLVGPDRSLYPVLLDLQCQDFADVDNDLDVDLRDFAGFQNARSGDS